MQNQQQRQQQRNNGIRVTSYGQLRTQQRKPESPTIPVTWHSSNAVRLTFTSATSSVYSPGRRSQCIHQGLILSIFAGATLLVYSLGPHSRCIHQIFTRVSLSVYSPETHSQHIYRGHILSVHSLGPHFQCIHQGLILSVFTRYSPGPHSQCIHQGLIFDVFTLSLIHI